MRTVLGLCLAAATTLLLIGCGASGEGGRKVDITQTDDGCTPTSIDATAGEKLDLVVKNDSGEDYEIEGIDGAKLDEIRRTAALSEDLLRATLTTAVGPAPQPKTAAPAAPAPAVPAPVDQPVEQPAPAPEPSPEV